jgi:hypothetical protein
MLYYEWYSKEFGLVRIERGKHRELRQAMREDGPLLCVIERNDDEDWYYTLTMEMPKDSMVQFNRATRSAEHLAGLRSGECPFVYKNGEWVPRNEP